MILTLDPLSGARHGRRVCRGLIGSDPDALELLPATPRARRRLIVVGQTGTADSATPAAIVLERDTTPVQHVVFPLLGVQRQGDVRIDGMLADWDHHQVTLRSKENMFFVLPVSEGRLDRASVRVKFGDNIVDYYDPRHGEGAWERCDKHALARQVAANVKEGPIDLPRDWSRE
jgi:hypothetical protein